MSRPAKCVLILCFLCLSATAQTTSTPLKLDQPIERELRGGQAHTFSISLEVGQYAHAVVTQRGIDVVVSFRGPDGQKLVELDTPSDDVGPEPVAVIAGVAGTYLLEVTAPSITALGSWSSNLTLACFFQGHLIELVVGSLETLFFAACLRALMRLDGSTSMHCSMAKCQKCRSRVADPCNH